MLKLFKQPEKGYLRSRTRRNAALALFWAALFMVIYVFYVRSAAMYVKNTTTNGVELDTAELLAAVKPVTIEPQTEHWVYGAGDTIPESLLIDNVYRDSRDYYRFIVSVEEVELYDIGYYVSSSDSLLRFFRGDEAAFERQGEIEQQLAVVTVGGQRFASLIPYGWTPEAGRLADCAVFTKLPAYVFWDLGLTDSAGTEVADYMLDFRNIPVESEGNDLIMLVIFSILFPLFFLYALLSFIFPRLHFNYLLASRYGDPDELSREIDRELTQDGVYKQSRQVYTETFILRETLHSTRIMMNHLKRH